MSTTITSTAGERLKMAREAAGLTQKELEDKIDLKRFSISLLEEGAVSLSLNQIEKLAVALGKTPEWLAFEI